MAHGAHIGPIHPIILKLKEERLRQGLSMKEVCRRANLALGQVSRLENGHTDPTLPTLSAWCRALGMELGVEYAPF